MSESHAQGDCRIGQPEPHEIENFNVEVIEPSIAGRLASFSLRHNANLFARWSVPRALSLRGCGRLIYAAGFGFQVWLYLVSRNCCLLLLTGTTLLVGASEALMVR
ncbi:hypothetical protein [Streptomyces sp. NBC_01727]|uniref:hypothetical protein n=1 Tax=Streptomyces sp. NBC_01727 TaxID=2975924 RepID=UPI002E11B75D|nr:hypothetical protein OIE76_41265 [Streptomyces sp. NBC_01727]